MRKFTLIAALLVSLVSANKVTAQSFTTDKDSTKGYWTTTGIPVEVNMKVVNNDASPIYIDWKFAKYDLDPGWKLTSVCDNLNCFSADTGLVNGSVTKTSGSIDPSKTGNFVMDFDGDAASFGTRAIAVLNYTYGSTSKQGVFAAYKGATGITTTFKSDEDITIFPNPASNYIDVLYNPSSDVKTIAIYNLIGKVICVYKATDKSSARCNFNVDMPSGIYLVRVADSKGNVIATRKITHQ